MAAAVSTVVADPPGGEQAERVLALAEQLRQAAPETASLVAIIVENYLDALLSLLDDYAQHPADYRRRA